MLMLFMIFKHRRPPTLTLGASSEKHLEEKSPPTCGGLWRGFRYISRCYSLGECANISLGPNTISFLNTRLYASKGGYPLCSYVAACEVSK